VKEEAFVIISFLARHCEVRSNPLLTEQPCLSGIATLRSQWRGASYHSIF